MERADILYESLIRLADDHMILGHRLSEWCGHAPMLEEDLAMPNIGLDLIGQARGLYTYAGKIEGEGRDEDAIAYMRLERDYHNVLLVERPNGDFAHTMLRQLYFSAFMELFWQRAQGSSDVTIAGIAAKALKETSYHVRHSAEWVIRMGDGTEESHQRMVNAVTALAPYVNEMFYADDVARAAAGLDLVPLVSDLRAPWETTIARIFAAATIDAPNFPLTVSGGRSGRHGEEMGFLLAELQYVQRAHPNLTW